MLFSPRWAVSCNVTHTAEHVGGLGSPGDKSWPSDCHHWQMVASPAMGTGDVVQQASRSFYSPFCCQSPSLPSWKVSAIPQSPRASDVNARLIKHLGSSEAIEVYTPTEGTVCSG